MTVAEREPGLHFHMDPATHAGHVSEVIRPERKVGGVTQYGWTYTNPMWHWLTVTEELVVAYAKAHGVKLIYVEAI